MGSKDYRSREQKKPKKGAKKTTSINLESPVTVDVVKKGKKEQPQPEE